MKIKANSVICENNTKLTVRQIFDDNDINHDNKVVLKLKRDTPNIFLYPCWCFAVDKNLAIIVVKSILQQLNIDFDEKTDRYLNELEESGCYE